jgi:polyribonucleotide nucleotidyltransferase
MKALGDMFELSNMLRTKRSKSMMRSSVHGKKKRAQFSKFGDMAIPKSTLSKVIGKDGQVLRHIEEQNRGKVWIDNEGNCKLFAPTPEEYRALQEALMLAAGSRLIPGRSYKGHVTVIKDFGAFVKLPESNIDALLHISEISHDKIKAVEDVLQEGQEIQVQFLGRDQVGSLRVSRKAVLGNAKSDTLNKNE